MRTRELNISRVFLLAFGVPQACSAPKPDDLLAASYTALAAVPLDSVVSYGGAECPRILVDAVVRYSEGVPVRADDLPSLAQMRSRTTPRLPWKCSVFEILALPPLPDTAPSVERALRVRLFLMGDTADLNSRRFFALVSPPGLAPPSMITVELRRTTSGWEVTKVAVGET